MLLLFLWRSSPAASPVRSSRTAGPTSSVQELGTSSGCFEASFKSWKLSVDDSPLHPRGWISIKFHQHHPSATSPPPSEPQPCPLQAGLISGLGGGEPLPWTLILALGALAAPYIFHSCVLWHSLYFLVVNPLLFQAFVIVSNSLFKIFPVQIAVRFVSPGCTRAGSADGEKGGREGGKL